MDQEKHELLVPETPRQNIRESEEAEVEFNKTTQKKPVPLRFVAVPGTPLAWAAATLANAPKALTATFNTSHTSRTLNASNLASSASNTLNTASTTTTNTSTNPTTSINTSTCLTTSANNINTNNHAVRVFLRLRKAAPALPRILSFTDASQNCISLASNEAEVYSFNHVFGEDADDESVFRTTALPLLARLIDNRSTTDELMMAYGPSGSGKTHTLDRVLEKSIQFLLNRISKIHSCLPPAILQQVLRRVSLVKPSGWDALVDVVDDSTGTIGVDSSGSVASGGGSRGGHSRSITADTQSYTADSSSFTADSLDSAYTKDVDIENAEVWSLWISVMECFDLLEEATAAKRTGKSAGHRLNFPNGNPVKISVSNWLKNAKELRILDCKQAMDLIRRVNSVRETAETKVNRTSSRSHLITTLKIVRLSGKINSKPKMSRIAIADLAGSENAKKTRAEGETLKQAGDINGSLFQLSECVKTMVRNQKSKNPASNFIPFRNTQLTSALSPYFRNGLVTFVFHVNPTNEEQTKMALDFSQQSCQLITYHPKQVDRAVLGKTCEVDALQKAQYEREISRLTTEATHLERGRDIAQSRIKEIEHQFHEFKEKMKTLLESSATEEEHWKKEYLRIVEENQAHQRELRAKCEKELQERYEWKVGMLMERVEELEEDADLKDSEIQQLQVQCNSQEGKVGVLEARVVELVEQNRGVAEQQLIAPAAECAVCVSGRQELDLRTREVKWLQEQLDVKKTEVSELEMRILDQNEAETKETQDCSCQTLDASIQIVGGLNGLGRETVEVTNQTDCVLDTPCQTNSESQISSLLCDSKAVDVSSQTDVPLTSATQQSQLFGSTHSSDASTQSILISTCNVSTQSSTAYILSDAVTQSNCIALHHVFQQTEPNDFHAMELVNAPVLYGLKLNDASSCQEASMPAFESAAQTDVVKARNVDVQTDFVSSAIHVGVNTEPVEFASKETVSVGSSRGDRKRSMRRSLSRMTRSSEDAIENDFVEDHGPSGGDDFIVDLRGRDLVGRRSSHRSSAASFDIPVVTRRGDSKRAKTLAEAPSSSSVEAGSARSSRGRKKPVYEEDDEEEEDGYVDVSIEEQAGPSIGRFMLGGRTAKRASLSSAPTNPRRSLTRSMALPSMPSLSISSSQPASTATSAPLGGRRTRTLMAALQAESRKQLDLFESESSSKATNVSVSNIHNFLSKDGSQSSKLVIQQKPMTRRGSSSRISLSTTSSFGLKEPVPVAEDADGDEFGGGDGELLIKKKKRLRAEKTFLPPIEDSPAPAKLKKRRVVAKK
ncbi:UNVERIFIED_CONTAM: hypothetical protein HDU68_006947 [Siphonaria sp. JEL0065]|nr:hypothetical protein HDU68_006947 [Siphonaria sp. JEL0065]